MITMMMVMMVLIYDNIHDDEDTVRWRILNLEVPRPMDLSTMKKISLRLNDKTFGDIQKETWTLNMKVRFTVYSLFMEAMWT